MPYSDVFQNHLYDRNFFENEIVRTLPPLPDPDALFAELQAIQGKLIAGDAEAGLDVAFTTAILAFLGWPYAYQQKFKFHGNRKIPDFLLFENEAVREAFIGAPVDAKPVEKIFLVWEDKAEKIALDNGKTDTGNPYFQLMEYLTFLRRPFGFLSNGHEIWYLDNSEIFAEKRYLGVNFDRLVESRDVNALRIFMGLFSRNSYIEEAGKKAVITTLKTESKKYRDESEEELRNAIYGLDGRDSLFERCGALLFAAQPEKDQTLLADLYRNCLYFTFRLIFIAFFEDRHSDILAKHVGYREVSLASIYNKVKGYVASGNVSGYEGWDALQTLFHILDQGSRNRHIPLFNGGLFASQIAAMLEEPELMTNEAIYELLDILYGESATGHIRDFSSLSVIQLGRIYESLLEYEFRIAEENLWYLEYTYKKDGKRESIDGYYDTEDYTNIKHDSRYTIVDKAREYKKGEVYLVGGKNSRKQSASYYTPRQLSEPLVKAALDDAVARLGDAGSILDLKLLDNACGSGHLLVESLRYLTQTALARIESDPRLKAVLAEEKQRIEATLSGKDLASYEIEVDELAVLKRILLKRTIYGVDLQPFAVELAKLSLWIETFVFGTPLSFIEHHIKAGNSLAGCPLARVRKRLDTGQANIMDETITASFRKLGNVFEQLSQLQDTTAADITESKEIYQHQIKPALAEMNGYFDLFNASDMLLAEAFADRSLAKDNTPAGDEQNKEWKKQLEKAAQAKEEDGLRLLKMYEQLAQELHDQKGEWQAALLAKMRGKYGFFNWELEFPEVFAAQDAGFDVIIGNPPWDKTKFSDPDFFAQYRSNYRQLSNSEKRRVMRELFAKPFIKERYEKQANAILALNEYYKEHFPCSRGAGDGNLFRFFVENNLRLLKKGGTLNYVIPTALWTDEGSTGLRKHIFAKYWLRYFYGFENRIGLFPDIHLCYKFGLMQIERPRKCLPEEQTGFEARFMLTEPADLEDKKANFTYTQADVQTISPGWSALMEFRSGAELELMRKIHSQGYDFLSPDWIDFRNELHATADKRIFREQYAEGMIPLYKGACIWQYDSEYWLRQGSGNRNEYWLKPAEMDEYLRRKERGRLIDDIASQLACGNKSKTKAVLARLGLKQEEELDRFIVPDRLFPRLAFRAIASDTNERTMVAAIVPAGVGAQNSLWTSIPKRYALAGNEVKAALSSFLRLFYAQAFLNSITFDWVMRCSIAINVNKTYLWRLPMPQPTDTEIRNNPAYLKLAQNSLRLSAFYNPAAFEPLFEQFGLQKSDRITTAKLADITRRENDLLVAGLYRINRAEMGVILDTFAVLKRNNPGYVAALLEQAAEA